MSAADALLCVAVQLGEGVELMHQSLCVDPTQRMSANVELTGIIADDDGVAQEAVGMMLPHSAPSVAICTGSGVTCRALMPRRSRCACQAS